MSHVLIHHCLVDILSVVKHYSLQFTQQQWRVVKGVGTYQEVAASEFLRNGEWAGNGQ